MDKIMTRRPAIHVLDIISLKFFDLTYRKRKINLHNIY